MECCSLLQGIFLIQGLNPGLLHCRQILYCLSHQGSKVFKTLVRLMKKNRVGEKGDRMTDAGVEFPPTLEMQSLCFLLNCPIKLLTLAIRVPSPPTQPSSIPPPLCSSRAVGLQEKSSTMTLASQDLLALEPIISFHLCFLYVH